MVKLSLPIKPLSINSAWQGRRYKTHEYKSYEKEAMLFLRKYQKFPPEGELFVTYIFYLRNYANTDVANLEKCLTDIIVKNKFIKDDRYIKEIRCIKQRAKEDRIEIEIEQYQQKNPHE
jgi:Holliday junction resolvase RusA-like endonuclease